MRKLIDILNDFTPISLQEMDRVELQNRTDTKFVFNQTLLPQILEKIKADYAILEINGIKQNNYRTLYYDTNDYFNYNQHQNGKLNRFKVRFRNYVESKLSFLEVKFKSNRGRTIKFREEVEQIETQLSNNSLHFIKLNAKYKNQHLYPKLWNNFTRITLVNKKINERVTIDLNLAFTRFENEKNIALNNLAIVEVKKDKANGNGSSPFIKTLKKHYIHSSNVSKYCIGTALLVKEVKANNFKSKILNLKKIENDNKLVA